MAKAPTLDDYIAARKIALEFELRQELGTSIAGESELLTNEQAAERLLIGKSTWFRERQEAGVKTPHTKRGNKPLWSADQVETVRQHLEKKERDKGK